MDTADKFRRNVAIADSMLRDGHGRDGVSQTVHIVTVARPHPLITTYKISTITATGYGLLYSKGEPS